MKNTSAIILILIAVGLFYTFISPQYKKVQESRAKAAEYQTILENVEALKAKRDELIVSRQSIPKEDLERISKVLPNNVDTVRLALDFDTIAAKYGISINQIDTDVSAKENSTVIIQPSVGSRYQEVTVSFGFSATYENFKKFLKDIESSLRVIDIESVSFTVNEDDLYDFKVVIKTYWLK